MSLSRGLRRRILLTLCLGVLLAQIDTSVVNLALRPISIALGLGVSHLQWIVDGYNLTYALLLLTGGLLGDLMGRRSIFIIGVGIFCAGCLTCGLAPGAPILIAGRILAGLGAALLLPASLAILRALAAPEQKMPAQLPAKRSGCQLAQSPIRSWQKRACKIARIENVLARKHSQS